MEGFSMRFFSILLMCISALACPVAVQTAAAQGAISAISFGLGEGGKEIITMNLVGAEAPVVFTIKGENPRLVLDFANATYHGKAKIAVVKSRLVKSIRSAVHHQPSLRTRVVVDLIPNQEVRHREKFQAENGMLTVTLEAVGQENAAGKPPLTPEPPAPPSLQPAKPVKTIEAVKTAEVAKAAEAVEAAEPAKAVKPEPLSPVPPPTPHNVSGGKTPLPVDQQKPSAPPSVPALPTAPTGPEKQTIGEKPSPSMQPSAVPPATEPAPAVEPVVEIKGTKKALASTSPMLLDVTFDGSSNKGELVQFKLNGFYAPHITAIEEGAPQVVCEYSGMMMEEKVPGTILAGGKFVKTIWITSDPAKRKVRIVLDLQPNKSYDLQQVYFKEDKIFVLIVNDLNRSQSSPPVKP